MVKKKSSGRYIGFPGSCGGAAEAAVDRRWERSG
jgi:hypothetical protein